MSAENAVNLTALDKEPLQDHCGIVAIYSPHNEVAEYMAAYQGLNKLQTRGYDGAGLCFVLGENFITYYDEGRISKALGIEAFRRFRRQPANLILTQTRYGTNGSSNKENLQPLVRETASGDKFAIVTNGQYCYEDCPEGSSDTVKFADELATLDGNNWDEKILLMQNSKKGAWSTIIATKEAIYLMRDPYGIRPLCLGTKADNEVGSPVYFVASETAALSAMGVGEFVEVMPGSVLKISANGFEALQEGDPSGIQAPCAFENAYFANGKSALHVPRIDPLEINNAPSIAEFRKKSAQILANRDDPDLLKSIDLVIGIPGTGIEGGRAFALASGLPYGQEIVDRKPQEVDERTFMTTDIQSMKDDQLRQLIEKHFYIEGAPLEGAVIMLVDDSIVRGNISAKLIELLKKSVEEGGFGVAEVHFRALFPIVDKPCHLGISTRKKNELLAAKYVDEQRLAKGGLTQEHMNEIVESMRVEIGADSLAFVTADDIHEAADTKNLCLGCTLGQHPPVNRQGVVYG